MTFKNWFFIFVLIMTANWAKAQIAFGPAASFNYLKGTDASSLPADWMTGNYNPSGWLTGNSPFRYGTGGNGGTVLSDMKNYYSTVYFRSTFNAQDITRIKDVVFSINFNDGFIIWINGAEAFSFNAPDSLTNTSIATDQHKSGTFVSYTLPAHDLTLKEGANTIAIQAFNVNKANIDFYFDIGIKAEIPSPQTSDSIKVIFSQSSGFYVNSFDLKLEVPDQAYNIVYTIDGSNPQSSATALDGGKSKILNINPTNISGRPNTPCYVVRASLKKEGFAANLPITQTYIFLKQVITQTNPGGDWPTKTTINSQLIDLEMDPDVTQNIKYSGLMTTSLIDIPSISIVTDTKNLFDPTTGIYVNALGHGESWERFCSFELIDPTGKPGFNINAGLRIRGGWSRHGDYPKHGFRLFFRDEYGAPKLNFPLFEDEGVKEFDKIDLRCEQNYSWSNGDRRNTAVREVFSRDTQRDMGQPYTRSRYYHLYLNGMYWGLFQTQERSEARYAADYFGGSKDDYDVVKVNTEGYGVEATDGNMDSWQRLYTMCNRGFAANADYFALEGKDQNGIPKKNGEVMVDIDNLIDYMLVIFYTGNFDAPTSSFMGNTGPNNFYAIDKRDDKSTGFTFYAHDSEHTMMIDNASPGIGLNENRVQISNMNVSKLTSFHPQWLHYKLSSNVEYRQRVADRVYKSFFNTGVFVPDIAIQRFKKRAAEIKLAIIAESARWGDAKTNTPYTFDTWQNEINDIYARFFPYRTNIVINQLIAANLYPKFSPPAYKKDNVQLDREVYPVSGNYQVTVSSASGQIFYTLDGTDPRMIGGKISSSAKEIGTGGILKLNGTAMIKSRVKSGNDWSALASVSFLDQAEDFSNLKVTELHYHPTDSIAGTEIISGKSFEFIELKNTGDRPINLSGLNFTSSIQYQFKENEVLAPKQFYVIASKPKWFYERHFMVPSGNFEKNFSNSGEQVVISGANGNPVIDFQYYTGSPWAAQANGHGNSLSSAIRNPIGNPADHSYWMASSVYDGTPFADDPGVTDTIYDLNFDGNLAVVYPNPTKGLLYLKVEDEKSDIQVDMFNLSGSRIYSAATRGNSVIDLGRMNIRAGIYLVNIRCNDKNSVQKVIYQP